MRRLVVLIALGAALVSGCGSKQSLASAKKSFLADCQNGEENQQPLCQCVIDQLTSKHGYKRAAQFSDLSDKVKAGRSPGEIVAALNACQSKAPRQSG